MTVLFTSIFSADRADLGPAVRVPERNAGGARAADQIMIGRTLGGATVAMIQGLIVVVICLLAGFRP